MKMAIARIANARTVRVKGGVMVERPKLSRGKRKIKKYKKDIGPGALYKLNKALAISETKTRIGGSFLGLGEWILKGMPRSSEKIMDKYRKEAAMLIKARKKRQALYKFRATEKQKKKYYGS